MLNLSEEHRETLLHWTQVGPGAGFGDKIGNGHHVPHRTQSLQRAFTLPTSYGCNSPLWGSHGWHDYPHFLELEEE